MPKKDIETYCPTSRSEWRNWLKKNHEIKQSVWLIYYKASTNISSLSWSEAVDEALCFGWIDSTRKTLDDKRFMQYFSKRKPTSTWSKINKEKVATLMENNLMMEAGLKCIEIAKQNGSWTFLDDIDKMIVPEDLKHALKINGQAMEFFQSQSASTKKTMLYWIASAKRDETRKKRIAEIVQLAANGMKPERFG